MPEYQELFNSLMGGCNLQSHSVMPQSASSGTSCRSDNSVKNHWNGGLSTAYRNHTLRTPYVRRQRTLLPLQGLMDLLQVSPQAVAISNATGSPTTKQLTHELAVHLMLACKEEGMMTMCVWGTYPEGGVPECLCLSYSGA